MSGLASISYIEGLVEERPFEKGQPPATGTCSADGAWPATIFALEGQAFDLVNQHRASIGAPGLAQQVALGNVAAWKARHMAAYLYMTHDDPAPPTARAWDDRLRTCGYSGGFAGENIAAGFADAGSVVSAWLNSPGHRANIENHAYSAAGLHAARGSDGAVYWCQDFGVAGGPPPTPPAVTVGQVFDGEFLPAMRAAALYKTWAAANPGEARMLAAYVANPTSPAPNLTTWTGKMLAAAVHMRGVSGS